MLRKACELASVFTVLILLCSAVGAQTSDSLEALNRKSHGLNEVADRILLQPAAKIYTKVCPLFVRKGVRNFFNNLDDINVALNDALQLKFRAAASDIGRLLINSSVGLGGLFDPASKMGLYKNQEDFGQTLAVWGVGSGSYFVIPLLGPSSIRDSMGLMVDAAFDPIWTLRDIRARNSLYALDRLHVRADLLSAESLVMGDRYLFFRNAYLQRREYLINDGEVEDEFGDEF
jgi:phospholipid-binding lipoprotein MlaA|tara:strand:+ start:604 stop:1299 length:696 start_codon:yes stop_codon:yes gene_type:complete